MSRPWKFVVVLIAGSLVAAGAWLRVTSATAMPPVDADEAFFGVQANRVLAGHAPAVETYTGNVVSPFNAGLQLPLIAALGPRWWILRVPTIAAGLLAVALAARIFRESLDRPTARLAALLLAVWPVAIISSRIGYDAHLTPLFSVLALGFAFQGRGVLMTLSWLAALSAHPTNLFLLPIVLPVFVFRAWSRTEGRPGLRGLEFVAGALIPSAIALVIGIQKLRTPKYLSLQDGPIPGITAFGAWGFVSRLGRLLLGVTFGEPSAIVGNWLDVATCAVILILAAGAFRLARQGCWDRLALILGLASSVAGFRIVGGSNALMSPRYALFAVVPIALGLACAFSAFRSEPTTTLRRLGNGVRLASIGLVAIALLGFSWINGFRPFIVARLDAPETLRVDREDSFLTASAVLLEDGKSARPLDPKSGVVPVYAESEWVAWPLMYLTANDQQLAYSNEWAWKYGAPPAIDGLINQALYSGGYAVGAGDGPVAASVERLHPLRGLRRWDFQLGDQRRLVLYRLIRPGEGPAVPVVFRVTPIGDEPVVRR